LRRTVRENHSLMRTAGPHTPFIGQSLRDRTGRPSHLYLEWSDGSPLVNSLRFLLLGRGQTATAVHEVLRRAVPRKQDRPFVHVM
ncbi:amino acid transporter, partial [Kocuria palustris]